MESIIYLLVRKTRGMFNVCMYARWEKRFEHLKKKANKILELGCYKGQTSKWFADTYILI